MKRYFIFLAIVFGIIATHVSAQTGKQKIAVYVTGDAENGYKKFIGSKLTTGITRSENYAAVERTADFLYALTKEQDYQMSGVVSDDQIAILGRQFGVRYVLVADISEIFESMFISARMIDVQTAQITNSTEADAVVDGMDSLTQIAETIVLRLFYTKEYAKDEIKILGPFSTVRDLYYCDIPENYHIATKYELESIIKNYQILKKKILFPIYASITWTYNDHTDYFSLYDSYGKEVNVNPHFYRDVTSQCIFIANSDSYSTKTLSFVNDDMYLSLQRNFGRDFKILGLYDYSNNPSITPGYVYLIKNKE